MREITEIDELKTVLAAERKSGKTIGFVPTMGYFHEGHLTLMREARARTDVVVVSIFVNPTQFAPGEDLEKYPRDLARDRAMAAGAGVDILFTPAAEAIYPPGYATYVEVVSITERLCGAARPGHFRGVATVVAKLFNIVSPDIAVFGQKDFQQLAVVRRMVADLNMEVGIIGVPTVREADGLAMSSRNVYLAPDERHAALALSRSLKAAQAMVDNGEKDAAKLRDAVAKTIKAEGLVELEYVEVCDPESLAPVDEVKRDTLVAVAARVGRARLIDNAVIQV